MEAVVSGWYGIRINGQTEWIADDREDLELMVENQDDPHPGEQCSDCGGHRFSIQRKGGAFIVKCEGHEYDSYCFGNQESEIAEFLADHPNATRDGSTIDIPGCGATYYVNHY